MQTKMTITLSIDEIKELIIDALDVPSFSNMTIVFNIVPKYDKDDWRGECPPNYVLEGATVTAKCPDLPLSCD